MGKWRDIPLSGELIDFPFSSKNSMPSLFILKADNANETNGTNDANGEEVLCEDLS